MKRTKIVCTVGPACDSKIKLRKMFKAGMNVARLNFSHGNFNSHKKMIKNVRSVAKAQKANYAILQDLQGPRIRLGTLPKEGVEVKKGDKVALVSERLMKFKKKIVGYIVIPIQYANLYRDVKKGADILIEDGTKRLKVEKTEKEIIKCKVIIGGLLKEHKGINVPGVTITADVITEKDKKDLEFGVGQAVDYVAISFVKDASDINRLRALIQKLSKDKKNNIKIIAKIERREAIQNFDSILDTVDGIMVARGDLGIELDAQNIPILQKDMIEKCREKGKPVIVATQMLDSMINNPQPTRAEVSDVANAVIDHADAVMLSGESAAGKYPVETVTMMNKIIVETEQSKYDDVISLEFPGKGAVLTHSISAVASMIGAKAIVVLTGTGYSARIISRNRAEVDVVALTSNLQTKRQLALSWGVRTHEVSLCKDIDQYIKKVLQIVKKNKIAKKKEIILICLNYPFGKKSGINMVKVEVV